MFIFWPRHQTFILEMKFYNVYVFHIRLNEIRRRDETQVWLQENHWNKSWIELWKNHCEVHKFKNARRLRLFNWIVLLVCLQRGHIAVGYLSNDFWLACAFVERARTLTLGNCKCSVFTIAHPLDFEYDYNRNWDLNVLSEYASYTVFVLFFLSVSATISLWVVFDSFYS